MEIGPGFGARSAPEKAFCGQGCPQKEASAAEGWLVLCKVKWSDKWSKLTGGPAPPKNREE